MTRLFEADQAVQERIQQSGHGNVHEELILTASGFDGGEIESDRAIRRDRIGTVALLTDCENDDLLIGFGIFGAFS